MSLMMRSIEIIFSLHFDRVRLIGDGFKKTIHSWYSTVVLLIRMIYGNCIDPDDDD